MDPKRVDGKEVHPPDDGLKFVDDPLGLYLDLVAKVPPLSRDEELRCIRHLRARDRQEESASKRLLEANLHLVVSIAERYPNNGIHILDLIDSGNTGLLAALQNFGESSDDNFRAHATPHIEHAIAERIAAVKGPVSIPHIPG
jgi:RNA polymerase primary sigma factor